MEGVGGGKLGGGGGCGVGRCWGGGGKIGGWGVVRCSLDN